MKSKLAQNSKLTMRQKTFIKQYVNPKSPTHGNKVATARAVGMSPDYVKGITVENKAWFREGLNAMDIDMLSTAEKNLQKYLNVDIDLKGEPNIDLARLQLDVSKFILKHLGNNKYTEDKKPSPPAVNINYINYGDKAPIDIQAEQLPDTSAIVIVEEDKAQGASA